MDEQPRYYLVKTEDMCRLAETIRGQLGLIDDLVWPDDFINAFYDVPFNYAGRLESAVHHIRGVRKVYAYANEKDREDTHGVPAHSLAIFVKGGDESSIARAIIDNKAPGVPTVGDIKQTIWDGEKDVTVRFSRPANAERWVFAQVKAVLRGEKTTAERARLAAEIQHRIRLKLDEVPFGGTLDLDDVNNTVKYYFQNSSIEIEEIRMNAPGDDQYRSSGYIHLAWNECLYTYYDIGRDFVTVDWEVRTE